MDVISISGSEDDIRDEFGWLFRYISICEGICPSLATCRRSLDIHYRFDSSGSHHLENGDLEARFHTNSTAPKQSPNCDVNDTKSEKSNCAVLLSAYREHVGPGLKVM